MLGTLALFCSVTAGSAQTGQEQAPDSVDVMAERQLADELGVWKSRWENLNRAGRVTGTVEGTETFTIFNGDRVSLLRTEIPSTGSVSTAFRFYNPTLKKLFIIDVQADGRHFILTEAVGSGVVLSDPFEQGGRERVLRFTTVEARENYRVVNHEISADGGQTWRLFSRQTMERESN